MFKTVSEFCIPKTVVLPVVNPLSFAANLDSQAPTSTVLLRSNKHDACPALFYTFTEDEDKILACIYD